MGGAPVGLGGEWLEDIVVGDAAVGLVWLSTGTSTFVCSSIPVSGCSFSLPLLLISLSAGVTPAQ